MWNCHIIADICLYNKVCGDSDLAYLIPSIHIDLKVLTSFS